MIEFIEVTYQGSDEKVLVNTSIIGMVRSSKDRSAKLYMLKGGEDNNDEWILYAKESYKDVRDMLK